MKSIFRIIFILVLATNILYSQNPGETGMAFLKLGFGARNVALSDLGVSSANDLTALYYNPALLSKTNSGEIFLSHHQSIQDVNSEMLAVSFNLYDLPFALGANTTNISGIEIREKPGEPSDVVDIHYVSISLSTSFALFEKLNFGTSVKYLFEGLYTDESSGYAIDFGTSYKNVYENLDLGLSISNLGSMNQLRFRKTKLPVRIMFGASYLYSLPELKINLLGLAGVRKYFSSQNVHLHFGGEINYNDVFFARLGYVSGIESKSFSAGAGIYWNHFTFDYAYSPYLEELGNGNTFSLKYHF